MPLTFLSHQAVVLPLKIRAPQLTSGTALVLGSMSPDVEYFLYSYPTGTVSHTWMGLITFCLPVTLILYWLVTRVIAEPVAAHLPAGGDFDLRAYQLLRRQPSDLRHWMIVIVSALVGAASHVILDRLSGGWSSRYATHFGSWLPPETMPSDEAWVAFKVTIWVVLAVITLVLMKYIGRNRLLERWAADRFGERDRATTPIEAGATPLASGPRGDVARATRVAANSDGGAIFWSWVVVAGLIGAILGALHRRSGFFMHQPATWVHIWMCSVSATFIGVLIASMAWHGVRWRSTQLRGSQS